MLSKTGRLRTVQMDALRAGGCTPLFAENMRERPLLAIGDCSSRSQIGTAHPFAGFPVLPPIHCAQARERPCIRSP